MNLPVQTEGFLDWKAIPQLVRPMWPCLAFLDLSCLHTGRGLGQDPAAKRVYFMVDP